MAVGGLTALEESAKVPLDAALAPFEKLFLRRGEVTMESIRGRADADKVSAYAVNAMLWAKKEGLIGGKPGNLADPQGTATRAEIATIFSNYMK